MVCPSARSSDPNCRLARLSVSSANLVARLRILLIENLPALTDDAPHRLVVRIDSRTGFAFLASPNCHALMHMSTGDAA